MNPRTAFLSLALMLAAPAVQPQQNLPTRYDVEVLVFRLEGELPTAPLQVTVPEASGITIAPTERRRLDEAERRLRSAGGYRVIAHAAWSQAPAAWNSRRGVSVDQVGMVGGGLTGTVFLERGQFLHLGFDLRYTEDGRSVALDEVRRVKVNETNYFDHPAVGIIAVVTPAG